MKKLKKSVGYAVKGVSHVYKNERNFRIHIFIALCAVALGIYLDFAPWKWVAFFIVTALVLSLEIINSAIEYTWNHLEPNHHPVAGVVKDAMAGAVLVSACLAFCVGIALLFCPN